MTVTQAIDRLKAAGIDSRTAPAHQVIEELTELATELRRENPSQSAVDMLERLEMMTSMLEEENDECQTKSKHLALQALHHYWCYAPGLPHLWR